MQIKFGFKYIIFHDKFKLFIKACHLLALTLVQSFASNIEDNF